MQRVLVTLNRENEALVVAEKARTRAFLDMESGRGHYYGGNQANIEIKSEGDIVSLVNRQKASVLYYSMAAGYLYSWLIVPTKGVVKFHEVCIEEDGEAGTNVVIQHIRNVRESLGVDPGVTTIADAADYGDGGGKDEGEGMWSSHLDALGDRLNQDKSGYLRMVNR